MKTWSLYPFLFLLLYLGGQLHGQPVFVKRYDQAVNSVSLEPDGDDLLIGGNHRFLPASYDFHVMKVDTAGKVQFSFTYDYGRVDLLRFVRVIPGRGYLFGGNSWNRPSSIVPANDSSSIVIGRLDVNGQLVRARKFVTAAGKGGTLTGLTHLPGGKGYVFSAVMQGGSSLPRLVVGVVDFRDSLVDHFDFPYSTRSNLAAPTNSLAVTDSGEIIVGWNFINASLGNVNEIRLVKIKDSLMVWQRRMVGDRMLAMAYAHGQDSLALYVVDSTNSSHGVIKVSLQNQGAIAWGAANTLNSVALSSISSGKLRMQNGQIASLVSSHFTFWPGQGGAPEGFSLPVKGLMTDFVIRGRQVYLTGTTGEGGSYAPVLLKSIIADTVSNCFTYYRSSPGFLPLNVNNGPVAITLRPPKTLGLTDTLVQLTRAVLPMQDSLVCVGAGKVWPGDANSDGVANNRDVLNVGLAYGLSGNPRPSIDSIWSPFTATNWLSTFLNGTDFKQADCNGDGVVDRRDLRPVLLNYRRLHGKTGTDCSDPGPHPPFYLLPHADSVEAGDTLRVAVMLGTATLPVDSIYGLSFSLCYDHTLVDSASVTFLPVNSWMGSPLDPDSPLISLGKDFYTEGMLEVGMSRSNQKNAQGYGRIALVEIFTIDDLAGKNDLVTVPLAICLNEVLALTASENSICLDPWQDTVILYQKKMSTPIETGAPPPGFALYPNPTSGNCIVELPAPYRVSLMDPTGRVLESRELPAGKHDWDLSQFSTGLYILRGEGEGRSWWKKVYRR